MALVIGNGSYRSVGTLDNAPHDAEAMAQAFRDIGFKTVQVANDSTRESMIAALRSFQDIADHADWSVVYYAGHGIEVNGNNYLIPVDAQLKSDRDVEDEAVSLDRVLRAVQGTAQLRVVILDACPRQPVPEPDAQDIRVALDRTGPEPDRT